MPTYEYQCDACGHKFEKFQSIKADPIRACPQCRKNKVRRLISTGAGLIFKGSGFYITDYRPESYTEAAKADSGTPAGGEGKQDKPSETGTSKPAASDSAPSAPAPAATPKPKSTPKPAKKT